MQAEEESDTVWTTANVMRDAGNFGKLFYFEIIHLTYCIIIMKISINDSKFQRQTDPAAF